MRTVFLTALLILLLASCSGDDESSLTPMSLSPEPGLIITFTQRPSATTQPTFTPMPTQTQKPTFIPTATWQVAGPGEVVAPILLYHHVDPNEPATNRYNTTPDNFAAQMQALADWGYTTITASQLVEAIKYGAPLPPRPVVITFDDGHYSVYEYAFPVMQEHGFFGVTYIVANRLEASGFTGVYELEEMIAAGWEVGSHSYTHSDLTLDHSIAFNEIYYSRDTLNSALSQDVTTFAYPFGSIDNYVGDRTGRWGYTAAMGLGKFSTHNEATLYYLSRLEVQGTYDLETFAGLLPWSEPLD
jgi:peptidoglycan/xylan/chitin deacetylase (PgdA/CDA1 family)